MQVGWDFVQFDYCLYGFLIGSNRYQMTRIKELVRQVDDGGTATECGVFRVILGFTSEEHRLAFMLRHG